MLCRGDLKVLDWITTLTLKTRNVSVKYFSVHIEIAAGMKLKDGYTHLTSQPVRPKSANCINAFEPPCRYDVQEGDDLYLNQAHGFWL